MVDAMKALALLLGIPALLLVYLYVPLPWLFRVVWHDILMPVVVIGCTVIYAVVLVHAVVSGVRERRRALAANQEQTK